MSSFWDKMQAVSLSPGEFAIGWLGQSGFLFKTSKGTTIAVDAYLTDCVERIWGLKRLMAPVIAAEDLRPDILVATHFHEDHLDIDAMPVILNNGKTRLLSPSSSIERVKAMGLESCQAFNAGDELQIADIKLEAVFADHGEMVPDAIGVLLALEGLTVYFCGDTAYVPDKIPSVTGRGVDLIIPPINGANGNLNENEAVSLAMDCRAKAAIPCHYWTFAEHLGNPEGFKKNMQSRYPQCRLIMMCQGEVVTVRA